LSNFNRVNFFNITKEKTGIVYGFDIVFASAIKSFEKGLKLIYR